MNNISEIQTILDQIKTEALSSFDLAPEVIENITFAPSPDLKLGDLGFPCFSLAKSMRKAPAMIAKDIAAAINADDHDIIAEVLPVGPYVNFKYARGVVSEKVVAAALDSSDYGKGVYEKPEKWMVEFSAPNTNKPQHLGHVRNDLLGASVSSILKFAGHDVVRVNLINDRGIHICKSMLAYQRFGEGKTPESESIKGDHFVGDYYVMFDKIFTEEYESWLESDVAEAKFQEWQKGRKEKEREADKTPKKSFQKSYKDTFFNTESEIGGAAKDMLIKWEEGDTEVRGLWNLMNTWVFKGFDETYESLGVVFEHVYRESETYLLGKDIVNKGVERGVFKTIEGGAIACDLETVGLKGEKILQRSNGTSVYMTQDLGTALARFEEYEMDHMVYVVGDEQDYHFKVLFAILEALDPKLANRMKHLSYGMVLLPEGKMKSREGKVVDADDLIEQMHVLAHESVEERYPDLDEVEKRKRSVAIGNAALKFYILDFNPKTTVTFDPKKSIAFEGRTGPYCLYSYARIQSIGRKVGGWPELSEEEREAALSALGTDVEMQLVNELTDWPRMVQLSARLMDPSKITEQLYKLCKAFSTMYNDNDHRIKDIEGPRRDGLLLLTEAVAKTLKTGLDVIGIEALNEM